MRIEGNGIAKKLIQNGLRLLIGCLLLTLLHIKEAFSQQPDHLYISEIMPINENLLMDQDGDYSDWFELHNPTAEVINIGGWYLSDNSGDLKKWLIPDITLHADEYLLIFASDKDLRDGELHTNFKLSGSGEKLILTDTDGISIVHEIDFPALPSNHSYGVHNYVWQILDSPTPGVANAQSNYLNPPAFSAAHGFFDMPFSLSLTSTAGAQIYFTVDGSQPSIADQYNYQGPILVDSTVVIRAISVEGETISDVSTCTYIFPEQVKYQPESPSGYPMTWGSFSTIEGMAPADYGMDSEITDSEEYKDLIVPALKSLPTISLVTDKKYLFDPSTDPNNGGIYVHTNPPTGGLGAGWERPVSIEYLLPDGSVGFQVNAGVRIHGGHSRVPEKSPKHSFRVIFRDEYGPRKLNYALFGDEAADSFNSIILRAGFNQSWIHWDDTQRERAQYINDAWIKDTFRDMGHIAAHNSFVHVYLNGMYWGLYNLSERMDDDFMETYLRGDKEDFDVIKDYAEVAEGNADAWNDLQQMAAKGLSSAEDYFQVQGMDQSGNQVGHALLDIDNLIDYMLLNFYAGNQDWDHHNWVAARNRLEPGKGFQFFPWDSERTFNGLNNNVVLEENENRPSFIYQKLRRNPVFRQRFAERTNQLLGPGGLLSPENVIDSWRKIAEQIELAVIAESARWGDYRRDMHQHRNDPYELYTKNDHWLIEQERLLTEYFPKRSEIVLEQLVEIGLAGDLVTGLGSDGKGLSHSSYPNPFSNEVSIRVSEFVGEYVTVDIIDSKGNYVDELKPAWQSQSETEFRWLPNGVGSGLYYYSINCPGKTIVSKILYMK